MIEPTHAGGIVFRRNNEVLEYLVINAKKHPEHWVFPKGHIILGEMPEEAAKREILEETGVAAQKISFICNIQFQDQDEIVNVSFFLMEYIATKDQGEPRKKRWCTYEESLQLLTFEDSRDLLRISHILVQKHMKC